MRVLDGLPGTLAAVDVGGDVAHPPLRVQPADPVLHRGQQVGPLVNIYLGEGIVVLRRRDHDIVIADGRLAVVRVLAVRGGGVGGDDRVLAREDTHDPSLHSFAFGVALLDKGVAHLHQDEVGRRSHRLVAWAEGALPMVVVLRGNAAGPRSLVTMESFSVK